MNRECLYQIEIADYSKRNSGSGYTLTVFENGKKQKVDILPEAPRRTLLKRAKSSELAKRWGARFGTVISCFKVDTEKYLNNIEYLNLAQEPIAIEAEPEYFLNKNLEITRPRREFGGKKIELEIVDEGLDK